MGQIVKAPIKLQFGVNEIGIDNIPSSLYIFKLYSKNQSWVKRILLY